MEIKLLETAGWYTVFKKLRESYSLDTRSNCRFDIYTYDKPNEIHFVNTLNYNIELTIDKMIIHVNDSMNDRK